jgi:biopolymer transport protein ExbD
VKIGAPVPRRYPDWQLQLINVVFLLLMFFVINGTISNLRDATIEMPKTSEQTLSGTVAEAAYIDVAGHVMFRGEPSTVSAIAEAWFKDGGADRAILPFQIIADRRLSAATLLDHLRQFRAAGFDNLTLVAVREPSDAP